MAWVCGPSECKVVIDCLYSYFVTQNWFSISELAAEASLGRVELRMALSILVYLLNYYPILDL